jgi:SNF2 family DNA or RNA helicase
MNDVYRNDIGKFSNLCSYCGTQIQKDLICPNVNCKSHKFSVGNRIILINFPDYGSGFIEKIEDFQTIYEYCSEENRDELIDRNPKNNRKILEKPIYRVKFKQYFEKFVSPQEMRHYIFQKDREIRTRYGIGKVKEININKDGNITYDVTFQDLSTKNLHENEIIEYLYSPIESLLNKEYENPTKFVLNMFGQMLHNTFSSNTIKFITNSRLTLMPHQVYVAHELIMKYLPRYILADEVGLGKTIEAGIFVKEMISREIAKKILIIVPANLVDQWIWEFDNKFSIILERFNSDYVKNLDRCSHPNIFYNTKLQKESPYLICSLQMARLERYREILTEIYWDIVIFDEAHHLRRYVTGSGNYNSTLGFILAKKLSEKARSLLLLTATPIQLHSFDLFSLLQLIRPDIFRDFTVFEEHRKRIPIINMLIKNLINFRDLNKFQKANTVDFIYDVLSEPSIFDKAVSTFYDSLTSDTIKENEQNLISNSIPKDRATIGDLLNKTNKELDKDSVEKNKLRISKLNEEDKNYIKNIIKTSLIDPNDKNLSYNLIEKLVYTIQGREKLIQKLRNYHFLSHFMFRNRKIKIFQDSQVERIVKTIAVQLTEEEQKVYKEIRLFLAKTYNKAMDSNNNALGFVMVILQKLLTSSTPALIQSLKNRIEKVSTFIEINEEKLNPDGTLYTDLSLDTDSWEDVSEDTGFIEDKAATLRNQVEFSKNQKEVLSHFLKQLQALKVDSKANELIKIIKNIKKDKYDSHGKVIIFTQFKKTLFYLKELIEKEGFKVEEFHGDMNRVQKNNAVDRFRESSDVLLSTEVGGEGRNFQFCNILINYDLPWNPMKLEQRIGRLDRIGQTKNVYVFNFQTLGTIENRIMSVLTKRIQLFEESIGNLAPILKNINKSINKAIFSQDNIVNATNDFEREIIKDQEKMEVIEAQLNDFILDRKSFQMGSVDEILANTPRIVSDIDIKSFVRLAFKFNQIQGKSLGNMSNRKLSNKIPYTLISLSEEARSILELSESEYKGIFDLDIAQNAESLDFLALGHPLINNLAEIYRTEDFSGPSTIIAFDFNKINKISI